MRKLLIVAAATVLLAGCSAGKDAAAAEQAVTHFHQQLDAGQFDAIYDASAPELKAVTPKAAFLRLLDAIHRKLGAVKGATSQGWGVNYGTGGGTVTLNYQTQFARGSGTEQFVYRTGSAPTLLGYHINSTDLIVN
jgi:opacity protein-like surface antigen